MAGGTGWTHASSMPWGHQDVLHRSNIYSTSNPRWLVKAALIRGSMTSHSPELGGHDVLPPACHPWNMPRPYLDMDLGHPLTEYIQQRLQLMMHLVLLWTAWKSVMATWQRWWSESKSWAFEYWKNFVDIPNRCWDMTSWIWQVRTA